MRGSVRFGLRGLIISGLLLTACGDNSKYAHAIVALVDVSGTYADEKASVVEIIKKGVLPGLLPGDTLMIVRIDSQSYESDNLVMRLTLDHRPSHVNAQKLAMAKELDAFVEQVEFAKHTDIQGGLMLAADYLRETEAGTQTIIAFSDMLEDLPHGVRRKLTDREFEDIRIVAVNVKRLKGDSADPSVYRARLAHWEERLKASGARDWQVIASGPKLIEYLERRI